MTVEAIANEWIYTHDVTKARGQWNGGITMLKFWGPSGYGEI